MNRSLAEKYFSNRATAEESRQVLDWFQTEEGQEYLERRLRIDEGLMTRKELKELSPELHSDELYNSIQKKMRGKKRVFFKSDKTDWVSYFFKVAAAVLVVTLAGYFTLTDKEYKEAIEFSEQEPLIYETLDGEFKNLTLSDGSTIRMNSNTSIEVSADYLKESREISLSGEAYFDIKYHPDQPFTIYANGSVVEVLGTEFNVRSLPNRNNVQVAVVEGLVAFRSSEEVAGSKPLSVFLSEDQYAYLDLNNRTLNVDSISIDNYISWKSGRFNFERVTVEQVCLQLSRLYSLECRFSAPEIGSMALTASFSDESVEKTLDIISMTLEIKHELQNDTVYWSF